MEKENELKNTKFIKACIKWIIFVICLVIFLEILENIFQDEIGHFDNAIYFRISKFISPAVTSIFKVITNFGGVFGVITIAICVLLFVKNKKYGIYASVNLAIIAIINQVLKHVIRKATSNRI